MKRLFKGVFIIISLCCILFTLFFLVSTVSGKTSMLGKIEAGLTLAGSKAHVNDSSSSGTSSDSSESTLSMLKSDFGLTTNQAAQVIGIANQLGVDTENPAEMRSFIAKNSNNSSAIKGIANMYQNGQISESQAKAMLAGIVVL